jgi:hypothetical protein
MNRQTRLICIVLAAVGVVILAGCQPRPTGISGTIEAGQGTSVQDLELHVVDLEERQSDAAMPVFMEGETVARPAIDAQGHFEALLRPGEYVLKLYSAEGELLTTQRVSVKRNRMIKIELLKE